jgi:hypothetical protein
MSTTQEQVAALVAMLRALPAGDTLAQLRQALPCGFDELTTWISRQPDASVRESLSAIEHELNAAAAFQNVHPDEVVPLASLDPADPRIAGFTAQLAAAWPAPEVISQAAELLSCASSTLGGLLSAAGQAPADSNLAKVAAAVTAKLGPRQQLIDQLSLANMLTSLASYRPGDPLPELGTALASQPVQAPLINTAFDRSGQVTASDTTSEVTLPGSTGSGFVQSRTIGPGQPGTIAAGLTGYLYRIDLTGIGAGGPVSLARIVIPTGAPPALAWPGASGPSPVFVITEGGTGSVAPVRARLVGHLAVIDFDPPLPAGQSSFFFGLATAATPTATDLTVYPTGGAAVAVRGMAPMPAG